MKKRASKNEAGTVPAFANEDEERKFWATHDAADFFDWGQVAQPAFPSLKPSTESISLRLPVSMLDELKALANKRDVPYQSLMKMYLSEQIRRDRKKAS
ncbi:MAG TPA: BrnA antitoxin family protein [Polyangia bacterium]|jgi:predicted DNA binding CopG/RHH family protein|nr:BrnA antitoxin family protein [Polyangia bacterium]